ncbi:hypothetical protein QTP88_007660 [Uroleucon formosanum]
MENLSAEFLKNIQLIITETCGVSEQTVQNIFVQSKNVKMKTSHVQKLYSNHQEKHIIGKRMLLISMNFTIKLEQL